MHKKYILKCQMMIIVNVCKSIVNMTNTSYSRSMTLLLSLLQEQSQL